MKLIRLFGMPAHTFKHRTSGVDFARIIQPLKALDGYKDNEAEFQVTIFDVKNQEDAEIISRLVRIENLLKKLK